MNQYKIKTTYGKGNRQALDIASDISSINIAETETLCFDFTEYCENNPFSNLLVANSIRTYRQKHQNKCQLTPNHKTYLSHLGFYQMIGADYGKQLGEARSSDNYVPITRITFDGDFYGTIDRRSEELAALLKFDKQLSLFLKYLFVETIRNTYEHAEIGELYLSAQEWQSKSLLEIAISDTGCGVCNSLRKYKAYSDESEESLIRLACEPGVSSRSNFKYLERDDAWRNSGYGLFLMRKLAVAYGGSFLLCSGNYALREDKNGIELYKTKYEGTTVAIRIKTDMDCDFETVRGRILTEGEIKSLDAQTSIHSASRSSGGHYNR